MSKWDSVKDIVLKVAPGLATGLGGPLAGAAVTFITKALGKDEDAAIEALKADPTAMLELKKAELEFQKFTKEAGIKLVELDVTDRNSARLLASMRGVIPQVALSVAYTTAYLLLIKGLLDGEFVLPPDNEAFFSGLIGALTAAQTSVLNFWFGSSSGSARKSELAAENGQK